MPNRAEDWFRQAEHDLAQARDSRVAGRHDWSCFASHQAAEKALKALHLAVGQEAWGHVLTRLVDALPPTIRTPDELVEKCRILDNFYIPTRYPNGHSEGAAFEHFGPMQSQQAIAHAGEVLEFAHSEMA